MIFDKDNRNSVEDFDEFFGRGLGSIPVGEGYDANEDVFTAGKTARKKRQATPPARFIPRDGGERLAEPAIARSAALERKPAPPRSANTSGRFNRRAATPELDERRDMPKREHSHSGRFHSRRDRDIDDRLAASAWETASSSVRAADDECVLAELTPPEHKRSGGRIFGRILLVLLILALVGAAVFLLRPKDGGEYYRMNGSLPQVENVAQIEAFDNSVWLSWDAVDSVAGYRIYREDMLSGEYTFVKMAYLPFTILWNLEDGSSYNCVIRPYCQTESGEYVGDIPVAFTVKTMPGDAQIPAQAESTDSSVTLTWEAVKGADGYEVHKHTGSWWSYEQCGQTTETSTTVIGLHSATEYTVKVRPYIESGAERWYGGWSDTLLCATSPSSVASVAQGDTTESGYMLTWEQCPRATGYEIYSLGGENGEETELVGQCGGTSYEVSGLESVTFRTYQVRAFLRYENGVSFGEYSEPLATVTLPSTVTGLDQYTSSAGVYTVSWQPTERAVGYMLYAYRCSTREYELIATLSEPSWTLGSISEYAERYKVCAYVSLGELTFVGEYSEELPCYPFVYLKRRVAVDVDYTALRDGAGPDFEQLAELKRYTKGRVFGEKTGTDDERWFRVELSDGRTGWVARADVKITNDCGTLATREYTAAEPIVIYLSPSRQDNNAYCTGDTTEKAQMEAVAREAYDILSEEYNCVVYIATPELSLRERAYEALELKTDVYLAIHSNATGNDSVRYGASSYYCGASGRSKTLGQNVVKKLNLIAPARCNLDTQMYSALESFGGVGYAEIRDPYNLGMVPLLAETDFHDNELTATWIIKNHALIGRAYAEALADSFNIAKKAG